jgi:hypothetical protein
MAAVVAPCVFGTAQVPDKLILDGKEVPLFENPLEYLWVDEAGTPVLLSAVFAEPPTTPEGRKQMEEFYGRRPEVFRKGVWSSSNWRGYVATWRIDGDRLMLSRIERLWRVRRNPEAATNPDADPDIREMIEISIGNVFPGGKLPIFAEWYSGKLRVPQGKMIDYVHMGYASRYERDTFLDIKSGRLVARADIENTGKNLYRTEYAQPWKTYGDEGGTDWSWIDPRLFNYAWIDTLMDSGMPFRTRGGFSRQQPGRDSSRLERQKAEAALLVYEIPECWRDAIPLHVLPGGELPVDGTLVEIECRFVKNGERQELHVSSVRELKPSEALFHTDFSEFIEKWRNDMNAERERKAAEAKKASAPTTRE